MFFKPIKVSWSIVAQKNKTKAKEKVCRSNWKVSKNRGIFKRIWWEVIQEILMFRMLWNILGGWALFLAEWKCIHESFPSEHARSYGFYSIWASPLSPTTKHNWGHFRAKFASEADRDLRYHPKCYWNKHWCWKIQMNCDHKVQPLSRFRGCMWIPLLWKKSWWHLIRKFSNFQVFCTSGNFSNFFWDTKVIIAESPSRFRGKERLLTRLKSQSKP